MAIGVSADEQGLSDDARLAVTPGPGPGKGWHRRQRIALIVGGVIGAALIGAWAERRPIATGIIDRKLAEWHVPVRYTIADLGLGRQRLTNVVIGDPAHPDLVADWVAVETRLGWSGARVLAVSAGHVRMRGRLVNGVLTLGEIDKLLPASSGKPFSLPAIDLAVDDARMRLEAPQGVVGVRVSGHGKLDNGFSGDLAAVSEQLDLNGCRVARLAAVVTISIVDAQPQLDGPVRAGNVDCGATHASGVVVDQHTTLGTALDRWQGSAQLSAAMLRHPSAQLQGMSGQVGYSGSAALTTGKAALRAASLTTDAGLANRARIDGDYRLGSDGVAFHGNVGGRLVLANRWRRVVRGLGNAAPGLPVAPLLRRFAAASDSAASDLNFSSDVTAQAGSGGGSLTLNRLEARARTGAVATLSGGKGVAVDWRRGSLDFGGLLALSGGGLPDVALQVRRGKGGAIAGSGIMRPYAAGDARLALDALDILAAPRGGVRFATRAVLSGPLGDGRVDAARLPLTGVWDGRRLTINPACAPVSADRLRVSSLDLAHPRLTLCPQGGALVTIANGQVTGGARVDDVALVGTLGGAALSLAAHHAEFGLADRHFALAGVTTRLGDPADPTRFAVPTLDGRIDGAGASGHFDGGEGRIAHVPLLIGKAAGQWMVRDGKLTVEGKTGVADAAEVARFKPLEARGVQLALADNRITATGTLVHPGSGTAVSDVSIVHDLSNGAGKADLSVPGITFGEKFQPDQLTPLTYGVIADVKGTVSGEGHISWTNDGVTSNGVFGTKGTDLAAAFGPVRGLVTEIRFTDLLNMVSAPDQVATVASINPGVAVENGVVHFALQKDQRVEVTGAEWPFASGRLTLEPTVLDFTEHHERHMTFRLIGVNAAQFLQQFNFKNLSATGTFDGTLPMVFNERGGRIENGHLTVRESDGGTIAYVGELSQKDLGFWGNVAFQSLKAIDYRSLTIDMNGPLDGEMVTDVRFAGVRQGRGAKRNFLIDRLAKLPIIFNIRINAPFRQLLDSAQGFYDPTLLVRRNLPALIHAQEDADKAARNAAAPSGARPTQTLPGPARPIQPPESEKRP